MERVKVEIDGRLKNPPQLRGAVMSAALGQPELAKAGIDVARIFEEESASPNLKVNKKRLTPQQRAEEAAKRMLEAGHTPQEIGEVVARILEGK